MHASSSGSTLLGFRFLCVYISGIKLAPLVAEDILPSRVILYLFHCFVKLFQVDLCKLCIIL